MVRTDSTKGLLQEWAAGANAAGGEGSLATYPRVCALHKELRTMVSGLGAWLFND